MICSWFGAGRLVLFFDVVFLVILVLRFVGDFVLFFFSIDFGVRIVGLEIEIYELLVVGF